MGEMVDDQTTNQATNPLKKGEKITSSGTVESQS
jgi:hypothetical protein